MSEIISIVSNYASVLSNSFQSLSTVKKCCIIGGIGMSCAIYYMHKQAKKKEFINMNHKYQNKNVVILEYNAKLLVNCENLSGECPIWDDKKQLLYWLDITGKKFWTHNIKTNKSNYYNLPEMAGSFCLCDNNDNDTFIFSFENGPSFYNPFLNINNIINVINPKNRIFNFEPNKSTIMNDGRVDRQGRFIVGGIIRLQFKNINLNKNNKLINSILTTLCVIYRYINNTKSSIYRINNNLTYDKLINNIICTNSICFSLDNTIMYMTDTIGYLMENNHRIIKYTDYNINKIPKKSQIFTKNCFNPDGSCIDSNGYLWSAQCGNGKVIRYDQNGDVNMIINVPAKHVTCCTFGGINLDNLFITTMDPRMQGNDDKYPIKGALFSVKIDGIKGCVENRFIRKD